jgi:hypothetical protein
MRSAQVFFLLFAALVFSACSGNLKTFKSNTNGWLPPDFDPKTSALLIERVEWPERQQKIIRDFMKEKYTFKYHFLKSSNIDEDYPDKTTQRFVVYYTQGKYQPMWEPEKGIHQKPPVMMFDFFFHDRVTGKDYPPTGIGGSFASQPFKYMINYILEKFKQ